MSNERDRELLSQEQQRLQETLTGLLALVKRAPRQERHTPAAWPEPVLEEHELLEQESVRLLAALDELAGLRGQRSPLRTPAQPAAPAAAAEEEPEARNVNTLSALFDLAEEIEARGERSEEEATEPARQLPTAEEVFGGFIWE